MEGTCIFPFSLFIQSFFSENDDIKMGRRLQFSNESDLLSEDDEEEEEYCGKEKKIVSETMKKREILFSSADHLKNML